MFVRVAVPTLEVTIMRRRGMFRLACVAVVFVMAAGMTEKSEKVSMQTAARIEVLVSRELAFLRPVKKYYGGAALVLVWSDEREAQGAETAKVSGQPVGQYYATIHPHASAEEARVKLEEERRSISIGKGTPMVGVGDAGYVWKSASAGSATVIRFARGRFMVTVGGRSGDTTERLALLIDRECLADVAAK